MKNVNHSLLKIELDNCIRKYNQEVEWITKLKNCRKKYSEHEANYPRLISEVCIKQHIKCTKEHIKILRFRITNYKDDIKESQRVYNNEYLKTHRNSKFKFFTKILKKIGFYKK